MQSKIFDIDAARADTPATKSFIHLNSCGSSLPPKPVVDAAREFLEFEASVGGYAAYAAREQQIDEVYGATARYLGCKPDEVAFTAGSGDSWWRAFLSLNLGPGDRVLTSHAEYQASAFALLQARERGVQVDIMPNDANGLVDLTVMAEMLDERVKVVTLTHVAMANGAIQPAAAVGELAHQAGAFFLLDSCQAAGQLPLNVQSLNCDFLTYTGRKFMRGMRGSGILFASSETADRLGPSPFVDGRSAVWDSREAFHYQPGAQRFEYGEYNVAGKVALGVATNYALEIGMDQIAHRIAGLARHFRSNLRILTGVQVRDEGLLQSGIVTFTLDGVSSEALVQHLETAGMQLGAPGRVHTQWDLGERGIDSVVRAGVHYFNTVEEIDRTLEAIAEVAGRS